MTSCLLLLLSFWFIISILWIYNLIAVCEGPDNELRGEAYDGHIYMGRLLETENAMTSQMCIQKCYQHEKCTSINYYKPYRFGSKGFCELLAETQWQNPKQMRAYPGGVYYERIACQKISLGMSRLSYLCHCHLNTSQSIFSQQLNVTWNLFLEKSGHPNDATQFDINDTQVVPKSSASSSHFLKSLYNKIADFTRRAANSRQ